jgi:N-methylhydantoinase B
MSVVGDPVTLAVLQGRFEQLVDEMDATLFRSAFNPIIAEAHDASHGIYHATTGATLVQGASGLPIFAGTMAGAVELAIEAAAAGGGPADGDIWIFNDPYRGGTHLNDMKLVRPYFCDGRLFCWLASVGHYTDVGGAVPGNYNPSATESAQEGVLVPPMKLCDGGELRGDVVNLIRSIGRVPGDAYGDLHAQLNALDLGVRRLGEVIDEFGAEAIAAAFAELSARAARLMRANIASLPDGVYAVEDFLDNDGRVDTPIAVALDLTISGDRMVLDFSRTGAAVAGPVNISAATARAACYVALKHIFGDVPANAGCLEPVEVVIPAGSLLDAAWPRPVGGYTETILRMMDVIFGAVALAAPERSNGCSYGTINALSIAGHRPDGRRWVMFTFYGGGLGGSPVSDGLNHGNAPLSTATIPPVEILEAAYPVRYTRWELRPDSGGPGRNRGGLGATYEIELLDEKAEVFAFADRGRFAPAGVAGGGPAARNEVRFETSGGTLSPPLVSKITGVELRRGDRIRIASPGGGGYGDPADRPAAAVARDLRLGYVTAAGARESYGAGPDVPEPAAATDDSLAGQPICDDGKSAE